MDGLSSYEICKLGKPMGKQDQYASAFGGMNWITFESSGVTVKPLRLPEQTLRVLESNMLLMFTGATHDSAEILKQQTDASARGAPQVIESLHAVQELAHRACDLLCRGELDVFGTLLDEAWRYKRRFAPGVSTPRIDQCYELALRNGALGGKIAGAGGGGFLLLYCEHGSLERVERVLTDAGLRRFEFRLEGDGGRVLFNAGLRMNEEQLQSA